MDLRAYYQKLRDLESTIESEFPIVVSRATGDGGKEGTRTEVPRRLAAKMILEGTARLATVEEANRFREDNNEARRAAEQAAAAARVQVTVVSAGDLERLRGKGLPAKG